MWSCLWFVLAYNLCGNMQYEKLHPKNEVGEKNELLKPNLSQLCVYVSFQ